MNEIEISTKKVHKQLMNNLKPHNATELDSIPSFILKTSVHQLATLFFIDLYQLLLNI